MCPQHIRAPLTNRGKVLGIQVGTQHPRERVQHNVEGGP